MILCFVSMLCVFSSQAVGGPSGLNVIPTADVLDRGMISLETESAGSGVPWGRGCDSCSLLQVGLGGGVEAGVDWSLGSRDVLLNAKWRVRPGSRVLPAVAFGIQGISHGEAAQPYIAVMRGDGRFRIHAGLMRVGGEVGLMLGVHRHISRRVAVQADHVSGDGKAFTWGVVISLSDSTSVTLARSVGNSGGAGGGHVLNVAWSLPFPD